MNLDMLNEQQREAVLTTEGPLLIDVYKRQVNRLLEVLGVDDIEDETFEKVEAQPAWTQEEAEEKLDVYKRQVSGSQK